MVERMDRVRRAAGYVWVALGVGLELIALGRGTVLGPVTSVLVAAMVGLAAVTALRSRLPRLAWATGWVAAVLLGLDFAGAVADRFGLLGGTGAPGVSWGSWSAFVRYTADLLPGATAYAAPGAAVLATLVEIGLAGWLLSGGRRRWAGKAAAGLLAVYAVAMATGLGWLSVAQFAVPVLLGGALLISASPAGRPARPVAPPAAGPLVEPGPAPVATGGGR